MNTHLHYSTIPMLTPTTNSSRMELGESVIFQPVLQAYPTWHSWTITAHISLGKFGMPLENLQQTVWQDTTTTSIPRSASISPNPATVNTSIGIAQHQGHIQFWWNNHNFCNKTTIIQPTMDTHPSQKKLTTLPQRWSQLAYWDSHYKRYTQH